ncbi:hypothetical protein J0H58_09725 [bacterium]|nr:hypothetical protein [bacterium]
MTGPRPTELLRHLAAKSASDRELLGRFTAAHDGDAFAELVRRHGPAVLAACRRGVRHFQDAENAFQAVFLILARRAEGVQRPELLGNWLYRVAVHVAQNARRATARRRRREVLAVNVPEPVAPTAPAPDELGPVLDEELSSLAAIHRDAVVLCDLRGVSRADAGIRPEGGGGAGHNGVIAAGVGEARGPRPDAGRAPRANTEPLSWCPGCRAYSRGESLCRGRCWAMGERLATIGIKHDRCRLGSKTPSLSQPPRTKDVLPISCPAAVQQRNRTLSETPTTRRS